MICQSAPQVRLLDLCQRISSGGTPSRKRPEYFCDSETGHFWVKSQELTDKDIYFTGERISDQGLKNSSAKYFPEGTVLIAMYGATVGKLGYLRVAATVNQAICGLEVDRNRADSRYVFYALRHTREALTSQAMGAAQQNLNQDLIRNFEIPLPELEVQYRIGSILSAYDELIENNSRRIEILEEMAQAIYREWFVEFRYPGHEDVPLVDSELGRIPEGWDALPLREMVELCYGKALKSNDRHGGDVPVIGSGGVVGWHDVSLVEGPGVIVGRKGNVGSVLWSDQPFFPIDTTYFVRTDLPMSYVYYLLRGAEFINSHAAVPGLSREQAYGLIGLRPTPEVTEAFSSVMDGLFSLKRVLSASNVNLRETRDLLLPKLISGEIDVSDLDIELVDSVA